MEAVPPPAKKARREDRKVEKRQLIKEGKWDKCMHWVPSKSRVRVGKGRTCGWTLLARPHTHSPLRRQYCSFPRQSGSDFCGCHVPTGSAAAAAGADGDKARMACPVDPSHTIFVRDKDRHVRVCKATTDEAKRLAVRTPRATASGRVCDCVSVRVC